MILKNLILLILFFPAVFNCKALSQQKIKDFYLSNYLDNGTKNWELKGEEATLYDNYVEIDDLEAKYYYKENIVDIKADEGKLDKNKMNVDLKDNVRIRNNDGMSLFTDTLTWRRDDNHITTKDKIILKKDSFKVEAEGLEARTDLQKVDFKRKVEVNLPDEKTGEVVIVNCSGPLEIDYAKGIALFNNDVTVESAEGKITSDKAVVYLDAEKKYIVKIICEGKVKIVRDDNISFAKKATYLNMEKKVILEGKPHLIIFPKKNENIRD